MDMLIDFENLEGKTPLTARQREILDLYYAQGFTQSEIADVLGMTQSAVCDHVALAVKKLARSYTQMIGGAAGD